MKKPLKPFVTLLLITLMTGCANFEGLITPIERKVVNNSLYTNKYPKAVITANKNLQYEGMVPDSFWLRYSDGSGGSTVEKTKYMFVSADKNKDIKQILKFIFAKINSGVWIPGFKKKYSIETGRAKFEGQRFETSVEQFILDKDAVDIAYLEDSNYKTPSCVIGKFYQKLYYSGAEKDMKLTISYMEPFDCDKTAMLLPENRKTNRTKKFLKAFNERADDSFTYTSL